MKKSVGVLILGLILVLTLVGCVKKEGMKEKVKEEVPVNISTGDSVSGDSKSLDSSGIEYSNAIAKMKIKKDISKEVNSDKSRENDKNIENTEDSNDEDTKLKALNTPENTTMTLSGDFWCYTNKKIGFNLKLPKKYWNDPRILILPKKGNDSYYHVMIFIPYYNKNYINNIIPNTSSIPKRYVQGINYYILSIDEYKRQIKDKDNGRGIYDISGIEILKQITIGNTNKYYFLGVGMGHILHEDWKKMVPELECEEVVEKYEFFCSEGLGNMFPDGMITFFDV